MLPRKCLDEHTNKHGDALIDFCRDSKCVVVNVTPQYDNYTLISTKGQSVVDYILVPQLNIKDVVECRVEKVSTLVDTYRLTPPEVSTEGHLLVTGKVKVHVNAHDESVLRFTETDQHFVNTRG